MELVVERRVVILAVALGLSIDGSSFLQTNKDVIFAGQKFIFERLMAFFMSTKKASSCFRFSFYFDLLFLFSFCSNAIVSAFLTVFVGDLWNFLLAWWTRRLAQDARIGLDWRWWTCWREADQWFQWETTRRCERPTPWSRRPTTATASEQAILNSWTSSWLRATDALSWGAESESTDWITAHILSQSSKAPNMICVISLPQVLVTVNSS